MNTIENNGTLHNLRTGDVIRPATADEAKASREAAERDGGVGAIVVAGVTCYVAE
jgi:hypothetical protein